MSARRAAAEAGGVSAVPEASLRRFSGGGAGAPLEGAPLEGAGLRGSDGGAIAARWVKGKLSLGAIRLITYYPSDVMAVL